MKPLGMALAALLASPGGAQSVSFASGTKALTFVTGARTTSTTSNTGPPAGAYTWYASKMTLTGAANSTAGSSTAANVRQTATPEPPRSRQPCNNHVEFCTRRYSNITHVAAHNSPFVRPGNSASNQELPVTTQLDDGVRLLQAQMHWPANGSEPHLCHTSCDMLDAGPVTAWLGLVRDWVEGHPRDVVTVLLGNGNYSAPDLYAPWIERSGLLRYAYEAPVLPMTLGDWPTLGDMLDGGRRVVLFMDYMADQRRFPWLLDQFSHMWETPFDPLDRAFPCVVQRPPGLAAAAARDRLYLMNHNLNVQLDVFGARLLVPAVALLNDTNAAAGDGSLGLAANNCRAAWGRAPNFVNVDYYNYGSPPGSVFEAAARVNDVGYDRPCCGHMSAAGGRGQGAWAALALAVLAVVARHVGV